jgi:hypothetical protein
MFSAFSGVDDRGPESAAGSMPELESRGKRFDIQLTTERAFFTMCRTFVLYGVRHD